MEHDDDVRRARAEALEEAARMVEAAQPYAKRVDTAAAIRARAHCEGCRLTRGSVCAECARDAAYKALCAPAAHMVGLTDTQIDAVVDEQYEKYGQLCDAEDFRMFARAILRAAAPAPASAQGVDIPTWQQRCSDREWRNLQAAVQMVCNMLERNPATSPIAANELRKAMDAVATHPTKEPQ